MSGLNWDRASKQSLNQRHSSALDAGKFGTKPATPKQLSFLDSLAKQMGYADKAELIKPYLGQSQTLSARKASEAIAAALQGARRAANQP